MGLRRASQRSRPKSSAMAVGRSGSNSDIWVEYNENGKSDFICTNAQTVYIRDGKLHMVSQMRSNDVVFGYKNDYAWAQYLMDRFVADYNSETNNARPIVKGDLTWQVMNLHVYARHFDLVKL